MSDSFGTYLHDHLAGSNFAIELLEFLRDQHAGQPLGTFATALLIDVEEDRQALQRMIDRDGSGVPVLKEAAAWMSEKVTRLKLGRGCFGTFQALEALSLGILGKRALWRALATIDDARIGGEDLRELTARAEAQYGQVEEQRLKAAPAALAACV